MRLFSLVSLVLCLALVGCSGSSALSMNKKMSYADSGATVSTAFALDQVPAEKFDVTKEEVATVATQLKKFLDDGMIADLPVQLAKQKIEEFMIQKGWQAYIGLVEVIFAWVDMQRVPVEKLGADNIIVIKNGLDGVIRQAQRAKKEWAVPFKAVTVDTTKGRSLKFKK